jgi:hypothetical protein
MHTQQLSSVVSLPCRIGRVAAGITRYANPRIDGVQIWMTRLAAYSIGCGARRFIMAGPVASRACCDFCSERVFSRDSGLLNWVPGLNGR